MHTKNPPGGSAVAEPEELSPLWIYDILMQEIEPDLTSANIKKLDKRYRNESPEDKQERYERYEYAFMILGECLEDLKLEVQVDALELRQTMISTAVDANRAQDKQALKRVENEIDSDTSA